MDKSKKTNILPLKPIVGINEFEIELNRVPLVWDLEQGCLTFFGLDAAIFWTDPSLVHTLAPLAEEIGFDLFRLLIAHSSSLGAGEDYHAMVSTLGKNFPEGFQAWGKAVSGAGWGTFELSDYDQDVQRATVVVHNPWELSMQKNLPAGKRWGCPFLQGKIIGIFTHALGAPCWTDDSCCYDPDHSRVTFKIYPSSTTIQKELKKLRQERMLSRERALVEEVELKTEGLNQAQADLEEYSMSLEEKVTERTGELQDALKQLEIEKDKLKQSGLRLQQREQELNELIEESPIGIFTSTPDGRLLRANKVFLSLFGFSNIQEIWDKKVNLRDYYVNSEKREKLVDELMRVGRVFKKEIKYKLPEKDAWLQVSMRKVQKADNAVEFDGFIQDVTTEKDAREALTESQQRLQIAFGVLKAGSWNYYPQTQTAYYGSGWFTMLGYEADEFEHNYDNWAVLVHPEDLQETAKILREHIESRSRDTFEMEYRMRAKDGTWRWILGRGRTFDWDDRGEPLHLIGANFDITSFKETQAALEESERFFRAIFNQTQQFIALLDRGGRMVRANRVSLRAIGMEEKDVLGRPFEETPWWPDREKDRRKLRKLIEKALLGEVCRKEVITLDKHGREHTDDMTIAPFRDGVGNITNLIVEGRDITDIKIAQKRMEFESFHDPLTRAGNRRLCMRVIRDYQISHPQDILCVIFLDIKQFKDINHAYGYHVGDLLLFQVAQRLSDMMETEDKGFRIGGDHFVILETVANREQGLSLGQKIKEALSLPFVINGEKIAMRISLGLTFCEGEETEPEVLLSRAALAHDEATRSRQGDNVVYDETLHKQYLRRRTINQLIPAAVADDDFRLEYQPVVDVRTGKLYGFEALLRWDSRQLGTIGPSEFIPIAEDGGQIAAIGEWVLKQGLQFWKEAGLAERGLVLSTNVSGKQFAQQGFFSQIESIIQRNELPPRLIKLEITETALMHNAEETIPKLDALRKLGVKISIDDFGTGYSSLEYLRQFSVDTLKIDMSFVQQLEKDNKTCEVVRAMINLAETFAMDVVGEGVETETQKRLLQQLGCHFHQGYLYSRPIRQDELAEYLEKEWT